MASEHTLKFDEQNFETDVLGATGPVLVDFWAEWCGPCLNLAPTIDELAKEYAGKAKVGKVDVDKAQALSLKYNVQSIPTVLVFNGGQVVLRIVGAKHKRDYKAVLDQQLAPK